MPDSTRDMNNSLSIATINANYANMEKSIASLSGEVREGNRQSTQQNGDIQKDIAVIMNEQRNFGKYQDECDKDRVQMRADVQNLSIVVTKIKTTSANIAVLISGFISVTAIAVEIWNHGK